MAVALAAAARAVQGRWTHLALTKDGGEVAVHVDGELVHRALGVGSAPSVAPWHVMRNGAIAGQSARGRADEVAVYDRALPAATLREHHRLGAGGR